MDAGVGFSDDSDVTKAGHRALDEALGKCDEPKVILLLATHSHGRDGFDSLARELARRIPAGATFAGGMVNGLAYGETRCDAMFNKHAVAVVALGGVDAKVGAALVPAPGDDPTATGRRVAEEAKSQLGSESRTGLVFTPGLGIGVPIVDQGIVDGIRQALPQVRLSGCGFSSGMKIDGLSEPGYGFLGDHFEENGTLLLLFGENTRAVHTITNGARPVEGGARVVLKEVQGSTWVGAEGGTARDVSLTALAGPDPDARKHFANNPAIASVEHALTLGMRDGSTDFHWAQPPGGFTEDGQVVGLLPLAKGTTLDLVRLDTECAVEAIEQASRELRQQQAGGFGLVVAFSCAMRGFTLADRASEEPGVIQKTLAPKEHLVVVANGEVGCRPGGDLKSTVWAFSVCGLREGDGESASA